MIQNQVLQVCLSQGLSNFYFLGKRRGELEVMEELEMIGKRGRGVLMVYYLWCRESWGPIQEEGSFTF